MRLGLFKRWLVGPPMPLAQARHERLSNPVGLAVFASDPLSSVAYATEEILLVLILGGAVVLGYALPISIAIATLIAIVIISYRQTIRAYPKGGGAYIVSKEYLGVVPGLVAGGSLMIDYILTVAVSVAAGVAAITSAVPALYPYRVMLGIAAIVIIALGNLRGIRESAKLFAAPTYLFVVSMLGLIVYGLVSIVRSSVPVIEYDKYLEPMEALSILLLMRAFSSGCTALTGIEAVSDGVAAFKPPEADNARRVLLWLGIISVTLFVGITFLAYRLGVIPKEGETVVSQLARHLYGSGLLYFEVQLATTSILLFAANTAFADFPRLAFFLARDRFIPRQFATQGDRLVFSNGIIILAGFASLLLIIFQADTHALIPLYAVGVFISFTLSQSSMVRRWLSLKEPGWWWRIWVSVIGAVVTGVVMVTIAATKFTHGAWIVVLLIPTLVALFLLVRRHYDDVAYQLSLEGLDHPAPVENTVFVLVGDLHRGVVRAIQYAQSLSPNAKAVYIELDPERTRRLEERWGRWGMGIPLVVLNSPYRSLLGPLIGYIDHIQKGDPERMVTIILPEFVPARWWQQILHNQTALLIKGALLFRRNVVLTDVPYLLKR